MKTSTTITNALRGIHLAAVCALVSGAAPSVLAQSSSPEDKLAAAEARPVERAFKPEHPFGDPKVDNSIVIMPWSFQNGTVGARQKAGTVLEQMLNRAGFNVRIAAAQPNASLKDPAAGQAPGESSELPTLDQMLETGNREGARYVLAGRVKWHTRTAWGFLSTKTKSTCSLDIEIADTANGAYALYVRDFAIDSTAGTSALKSAAGFIPYAGVGIGMISAGPKTPEEQRAVLLATTYALQPWIQTWRQNNGTSESKRKAVAVK